MSVCCYHCIPLTNISNSPPPTSKVFGDISTTLNTDISSTNKSATNISNNSFAVTWCSVLQGEYDPKPVLTTFSTVVVAWRTATWNRALATANRDNLWIHTARSRVQWLGNQISLVPRTTLELIWRTPKRLLIRLGAKDLTVGRRLVKLFLKRRSYYLKKIFERICGRGKSITITSRFRFEYKAITFKIRVHNNHVKHFTTMLSEFRFKCDAINGV